MGCPHLTIPRSDEGHKERVRRRLPYKAAELKKM